MCETISKKEVKKIEHNIRFGWIVDVGTLITILDLMC